MKRVKPEITIRPWFKDAQAVKAAKAADGKEAPENKVRKTFNLPLDVRRAVFLQLEIIQFIP